MSETTNIMQFDLLGLEQLMLDCGEGKYRGLQLAEWIYLRSAESFAGMNNLPKALRESLSESFTLKQPEVRERLKSTDGTVRYLLELADGAITETVVIPSQKRLTVCVSSQIGCALGCTFCATGSLGYSRTLLPGEMASQLSVVLQDFPDTRISNVVAMGQGEPFAHYDTTLSALRMMNHPKLFGVGARHITVSTAGLVRQIRRFAEEPEQFTLAVSLHSALQQTRNKLMPGLSSQSLEQLRSALLFYMENTSRRPSLEYALIKGINDDDDSLASLLAFCKVPAPGFHINLITLNTVDTALEKKYHFLPASLDTFKRFEQALSQAGVGVSKRVSKGSDIAAACGQLASRYKK